MKDKYLITGKDGLLGSSFVRALDDQNYVWRKEGGIGICFTLQVYI